MVIADLIHSCSNANVARVAVRCVGEGFADRVASAADRNGMEMGRFASVVVRQFARCANGDALSALGRSIVGADQPLLAGLVHVLEPALEDGASFLDDEDLCFAPRAGADYRRAGLQ
ncbi:MAG TPA: hypothetical protein VK446_15590 [Methylocystis sp.]|nr:hypothetical protein [Methylocystis sp.]